MLIVVALSPRPTRSGRTRAKARPELRQRRPTFGQPGPGLDTKRVFRLSSAGFGRSRPGIGRNCRGDDRHRPTSCDIGPRLLSHGIGCFRSSLGRVRPSLVEFGPDSADVGPDSVDLGPNRVTSAPMWCQYSSSHLGDPCLAARSRFGPPTRPSVGSVRPNLGPIRTDLGGSRPWLRPLGCARLDLSGTRIDPLGSTKFELASAKHVPRKKRNENCQRQGALTLA